MIKAVLFDNFGVMYIPKHEYLYQTLLMNPSLHRAEIEDLRRQSEYGFITDEELLEAISRLTGVRLSEVKNALVDGFVRNHELLDTAQALRPKRKVALVSNIGINAMPRYFTPDEQRVLFDLVVMSSSVGMIKPHPEIFVYTCRQLGVDVSEAVMIDDIQDNCDGATAAGLQAILYQSLPQAKADLAAILGN